MHEPMEGPAPERGGLIKFQRKGRQMEEKLLEESRTFKDAYCKLEPGVPDCKTSICLNQFTGSGGYLNQ